MSNIKSASEEQINNGTCCKGRGTHSKDCTIKGGTYYDRETETLHENITHKIIARKGEFGFVFVKDVPNAK